ncbi:MAG: TetR/AcrR family transcriptional regulator [Spirochaetes bacterium]|nr:TetR/AcrR family transcriptional regulator [Spirochaetota bacterium]MBU1080416.1 TetR/AcrR family transcriptional regulator [Spirochaetota bacterium]
MDGSLSTAPRWTPVFERISDEKRRRVLQSAKVAFARDGFAGTNVNLVAAAAGISVGALYKYFRTKADLFLAIVDEYEFLLGGALENIFSSEPTFAGRIEALIRAAVRSAQDDPELLRIYVDCTTEALSGMAVELSGRIETVSATMYRRMIAEAAASGEIASDVDPAFAAFLLDDIFLMIQFSYASTYYRNRLRIFIGEARDDTEAVVAAAMRFIMRTFEPRLDAARIIAPSP